MLLLGFPLGVLMQGVFAGIGATISESYPNDIRATGYGVSYNIGRVIGSLFPLSVGWLSSGRTSLPIAIAIVAGAGYAMVVGAALLLPETRGMDLDCAGGSGGPDDDRAAGRQRAGAGAGGGQTCIRRRPAACHRAAAGWPLAGSPAAGGTMPHARPSPAPALTLCAGLALHAGRLRQPAGQRHAACPRYPHAAPIEEAAAQWGPPKAVRRARRHGLPLREEVLAPARPAPARTMRAPRPTRRWSCTTASAGAARSPAPTAASSAPTGAATPAA